MVLPRDAQRWERYRLFLERIPWRLLIILFGVALVVHGGSHMLSVDLSADPEAITQAAKQGMGLVVIGGVMLIAASMIR